MSPRPVWATLETLHGVVYFDPRVKDAGVALGLRGFWATYFAFRAAPFGAVAAPVVVASFAGFHPEMVARALPSVWSAVTPAQCLATRAATCAVVLRSVGVTDDDCGRALALVGDAVLGADPTGRPLFAANAAVPLGDDPVAALWQVATTFREHRGDAHVAALVAAGLSGLDGHVLQVGLGTYPAAAMQAVRGWSPLDWAAASGRLQERGLLRGDALTDLGRDVLADVEARTDAAAAVLDPSVVRVLAPAVAAVRASGVLPAFNPTGLPAR